MDQSKESGSGNGARRRVLRSGIGLAIVVVIGIAALALGRVGGEDPGEVVEDPWELEAELDDVLGSDHIFVSFPGADDPADAAGEEEDDAEYEGTPGVDPEPFDLPPLERDVFPAERAPLVPKPEAVRGLYFNAWSAGSTRRMSSMIELANRTEINAFVLDVKDDTGYMSYPTGVGLARQISADEEIRIRDVRGLLERLRENGIYPIARIVVFKDPLLAKRRPDLSIQKADGKLWIDHYGDMWVDPYNKEVWDYNIAVAREAVMLGFSEVQWDYVRFPDVPQRYMREAVYPAQAGRSREDAIREFLEYSREQLADLGVPVTADVFGLTVSAGDDMGIGQRWSKMVDVTDVLLPMIYPSHFARGSYGIPVPNAAPYETVKTALDYAVRRTRDLEQAAAIRPWLQDFTLGDPRYDAAHVRAQIQATYDAGISEWILWNPAGRYTAEALASADGVEPDLVIPRLSTEDEDSTPTLDLPTPRVVGVPVTDTPAVPMPKPVSPAGARDSVGG